MLIKISINRLFFTFIKKVILIEVLQKLKISTVK